MLALLVALAVSAPATLSTGAGAERPAAPILDEADAAAAVDKPVRLAQSNIDPNAPDHTPTFVEQFLAFQISPVPSKQVSDGLVLSHVIGYVCSPVCGGLWGPLLATKDAQLTGDVFVSWFVSGLVWGLISVVASVTIVGALLFFIVPYLSTTATLNAIDRDLKKRGLAEDRQGNPMGSPAAPPPPPPTATTPSPAPQQSDTPPPSYAY